MDGSILGPAPLDAIVRAQIFGRQDYGMFADIFGGRDGEHPVLVEDSDGNHVLLDPLADADAGVDSLVDDVSVGIIRDDLKRDIGVFAQEFGNKRRDDRYGGGAYDAQP